MGPCYNAVAQPEAVLGLLFGMRRESLREYEMVLVLKPDLGEEELPAAVDRITGFIAASGGEVAKVDPWGRRKLAYPIQKYVEGNYVLTQFKLEPSLVMGLEANLRLDEHLLRHLIVRAEE